MKHIADIIERGIREHPELSVGMQTEGIEVKFIINLSKLKHKFVLERLREHHVSNTISNIKIFQHLGQKCWQHINIA